MCCVPTSWWQFWIGDRSGQQNYYWFSAAKNQIINKGSEEMLKRFKSNLVSLKNNSEMGRELGDRQ